MAWCLASSRRHLVASPSYLIRHGTPKSLAELEQHRGIFYTNRGAADWRFMGPEHATIVRGTIGLRVNNGDMMRDAAVAGLGIALLPSFIVGAEVRTAALTVIDVGAEVEPEFVYIAHPEGRRPSSSKVIAILGCCARNG